MNKLALSVDLMAKMLQQVIRNSSDDLKKRDSESANQLVTAMLIMLAL